MGIATDTTILAVERVEASSVIGSKHAATQRQKQGLKKQLDGSNSAQTDTSMCEKYVHSMRTVLEMLSNYYTYHAVRKRLYNIPGTS